MKTIHHEIHKALGKLFNSYDKGHGYVVETIGDILEYLRNREHFDNIEVPKEIKVKLILIRDISYTIASIASSEPEDHWIVMKHLDQLHSIRLELINQLRYIYDNYVPSTVKESRELKEKSDA